MKKILMSWSGGYDSTYLLYKNLKDGNEVTTLYVDSLNLNLKRHMEKEAISHMIPYFKENFKDTFKEHIVGEHSYNNANKYFYLHQPLMWLSQLAEHCSDFDECHVGYINGDCAISYIDDMKEIWQKIFVTFSNYNVDDIPQLVFPLMKTPKWDCINNVPDDLLKYITTCENPIEKHSEYYCCGLCEPCQKMVKYLFEIKEEKRNTIKGYELFKQINDNMEKTVNDFNEPYLNKPQHEFNFE